MLLWLVIVALTALVVAAIVLPLVRPRPVALDTDGSDHAALAIYKDQLAEIDADLARGMIGATEATAARLELSRRILALAPDHVTPTGPPNQPEALPVARMAIAVSIPLVALALYAALGTPSLPGVPSVATAIREPRPTTPAAADIDQLIAKVEERLRANPEDGRGWDVLAPVYLRAQRYEEARTAFARAISMLGENPKRLAGLAESAIRARGGIVTDEARDAYAKVLLAEPDRLEARFWLALAREQRGDLKGAADEYRALLSTAPADAAWRAAVTERLAALSAASANAPAIGGVKGPTATDIAASAAMTPEARQQMITGMVTGLHFRLKADGRDADGWQRLLRGYTVLGELAKANEALADARRALSGDQAGLTAIDALALELGLRS
jgi:cytochrome c-type biogenesis protein CcmH